MPSTIIDVKKLPPVRTVLNKQGILDRAIEIKLNAVKKGLDPVKANMSAISVLQGVFEDGKRIRIITTMDETVYKCLRNNPSLLKPGEILGPEPFAARELVAGKFREKFGRNLPIHAEQLGVEFAASIGVIDGHVATSILGCDVCESYIKEYYPQFKHLNLESYELAQKSAERLSNAANQAQEKATRLEKKVKDAKKTSQDARKAAQDARKAAKKAVKEAEDAKKIAKKAVEEATNLENELNKLLEADPRNISSPATKGRLTNKLLEADRRAIKLAKKSAERLSNAANQAQERATTLDKKAVKKAEKAKEAAKKVPSVVEEATKAKDVVKKAVEEAEKAKKAAKKAIEEATNLEIELNKLLGTYLDREAIRSRATEGRFTKDKSNAPFDKIEQNTEKLAKEERVVAQNIEPELNKSLAADQRAISSESRLTKPRRLGSAAEHGLAKTTQLAKLSKISIKGLRLIRSIGKFAFLLFIPTSLLDIAFTLAIELYDWDQKRRRRLQEELHEIINFLFTPNKLITVYKYNNTSFKYRVGCLHEITEEVHKKLFSDQFDNISYWLSNWNNDKKWIGFVYGQIVMTVQIHQEKLYTYIPDHELKKYYFANIPDKVNFKRDLTENTLLEKYDVTFQPNDKRNLFTGEHSMTFIADNVAGRIINYTMPTPILTPFDFIIIKCRSLIAEIISFVSHYDSYVVEGMEQFNNDDYFDIYRINWLENYPPINSSNAHYCLTEIDKTIHFLKQHKPDDNSDFERGAVYELTKGHNKRKLLLEQLNRRAIKGKTKFYHIGLLLNNLISAQYDSSLLMNLAFDIDEDIKKAYQDCISKNKYRAHHFEYRGSLIDP
jgi:hypothetical protein